MADVFPTIMGPMQVWSTSTSISAKTVDAANDGLAFCFAEPRGGVAIDTIHFPAIAVLNGSPTALAQLESVSSGAPSGTIIAAGASRDQAVTGGALNSFDLTTPYTPSNDDEIAVVVKGGATIGSGTNDFTIPEGAASGNVRQESFLELTGGTYTKVNRVCPIFIEYNDGMILPVVPFPATSITYTAFNLNTASEDEKGVVWTPATTMDICGAVFSFETTSATADYEVCLYTGAAASATERRAVLVPGDHMRSTFDVGWLSVSWAPYTVTSSDTVRLTLKPTTTGSVRAVDFVFPSSAARAYACGPLQKTHRADLGTFTDTATNYIPISPVISDITPPAGGGSQGISQGLHTIDGSIVA